MALSINQSDENGNLNDNKKRIQDDYKLSGEPIVTEDFVKLGGDFCVIWGWLELNYLQIKKVFFFICIIDKDFPDINNSTKIFHCG